jgi:diguanylate cyclase (GGDEF)-like protein
MITFVQIHRDRSTQHRPEVQMLASFAFQQALLADASVAAAAFDSDLVCRYTNPRFASLGAGPRPEGRSLFAILDLDARQIRDVRDLLDGHVTEVSLDLTTVLGRSVRLGPVGAARATWNARLFRTAVPGGGTGLGLLAVDVTPQYRLVEQLRHNATHDRLTGLLNAAGLADELGVLLAQPDTADRPLFVLFGDLKGFKAINDRIGHHAGDRVLQVVGQRLRDAVREQDRVARAGGDEFVVLVSGPAQGDSVARVVSRLERAVQRPISVEGNRVSVGMTIGAVRTEPDDAAASVLRRADAAMRAKRFTTAVGRDLPVPARSATPEPYPVPRPGRVGLKRLLPARPLRTGVPDLSASESGRAPETRPLAQAAPAARHRAAGPARQHAH